MQETLSLQPRGEIEVVKGSFRKRESLGILEKGYEDLPYLGTLQRSATKSLARSYYLLR